MLAAGATERDLDVLAVLLVLRVILHTKRDFTRSRGSHRMYCPACRRYVDGGSHRPGRRLRGRGVSGPTPCSLIESGIRYTDLPCTMTRQHVLDDPRRLTADDPVELPTAWRVVNHA